MGRHIQGYREELGDTSQDHDDRNHKVDDPATMSRHELANPLTHLEAARRLGGKEAPAQCKGFGVQAVGEVHFVLGR